jgi:hypothetical protein
VAATRYFEEQVLRKRPYLTEALCRSAIASPLRTEVQSDGRIRILGRVLDPRDATPRILRVVVLCDAETLHNAFFDRDFQAP